MKALEEFGLQDFPPLHDFAASKFGSDAEVAHQLQLEARRRRYAATTPGPRNFPTDTDFVRDTLPSGKGIVILRPHWGTESYVQWFEQANHLRRVDTQEATCAP